VEGLARRVTEVKERHYQELTAGGISAFAGAAQLIARARQLGMVLGVGSSGAPAKIRHNLASSGLLELLRPEVRRAGTRPLPATGAWLGSVAPRCSALAPPAPAAASSPPGWRAPPLQVEAQCIVSAAYVERGKPAPDVYIEALRRMGCSDASRALVVEDAVHGLNAARGAGAFAVAVTTSLPRERLEAVADVVVGSLGEVAALLEALVPQGRRQQPVAGS
jgi:dual specificity phosphatase 12